MKRINLEYIKAGNYTVISLSATTCAHHDKKEAYEDAIEYCRTESIDIDNYLNDENYFSQRNAEGFFNFEKNDVSFVIDKHCGCRWELVLAEVESEKKAKSSEI